MWDTDLPFHPAVCRSWGRGHTNWDPWRLVLNYADLGSVGSAARCCWLLTLAGREETTTRGRAAVQFAEARTGSAPCSIPLLFGYSLATLDLCRALVSMGDGGLEGEHPGRAATGVLLMQVMGVSELPTAAQLRRWLLSTNPCTLPTDCIASLRKYVVCYKPDSPRRGNALERIVMPPTRAMCGCGELRAGYVGTSRGCGGGVLCDTLLDAAIHRPAIS
eukprot:Hpha_TRINITY_DN25394_c0_g1::TRINITY_DN25394_c0_g1_i1::g.2761::m.2761